MSTIEDQNWQMQTARVLEEVRAERDHQRVEKKYSRESDDLYPGGQLARAGVTYAYFGSMLAGAMKPHPEHLRFLWPWNWVSFNPRPDARQALVRAAALIVAEIEKMDRAAARGRRPDAERAP